MTNKQEWLWQESARGVCALCDDTVAGPGWVEYTKHDGSEKAVRLICFNCNREDLNKWYSAQRGYKQPNVSVVEPPPPPVPQTNVPQPQTFSVSKIEASVPHPFPTPESDIGETVVKRVRRDPQTGFIADVIETRFNNKDYFAKRKSEQRTPEQWEAALGRYANWKRERNKRRRGRQ